MASSPNDVTHILAPATQSKITQEFTTMLYRRRRGYDERKEERLHAFTAGSLTQHQDEHNAAHRGSSDTASPVQTRKSSQRNNIISIPF